MEVAGRLNILLGAQNNIVYAQLIDLPPSNGTSGDGQRPMPDGNNTTGSVLDSKKSYYPTTYRQANCSAAELLFI